MEFGALPCIISIAISIEPMLTLNIHFGVHLKWYEVQRGGRIVTRQEIYESSYTSVNERRSAGLVLKRFTARTLPSYQRTSLIPLLPTGVSLLVGKIVTKLAKVSKQKSIDKRRTVRQ